MFSLSFHSKSKSNTVDSSSIISHSLCQRKMVDNQQQTQLYPTKINISTSTQVYDRTSSESSWFDLICEDQTTINAWARIRSKLKPNQQKDILRYEN